MDHQDVSVRGSTKQQQKKIESNANTVWRLTIENKVIPELRNQIEYLNKQCASYKKLDQDIEKKKKIISKLKKENRLLHNEITNQAELIEKLNNEIKIVRGRGSIYV